MINTPGALPRRRPSRRSHCPSGSLPQPAGPQVKRVLFHKGTPISDILILLGGCGAIGAATLAAAGGGRRLMAVVVEAAVRSGAGK
ncbi:hypothetical protein AB0H03_13710 [Streptomyces sparsogenes]|uniref:hypothetical protein n=1 Tax=Streptomyces sparsogenes TaxID=67365 RepID=UPI0033E16205